MIEPIYITIFFFILLSVIIAFSGIKLTKKADQLADKSRMGEAVMGAVILGSITSLSGITTSVTAAFLGHPVLAISNAIGGIAAQTAFLSIADIFYRKSNIEHASVSIQNLMQGALLIILLAITLVIAFGPEISFKGIHPGSFAIVAVYIIGIWIISKSKKRKMWIPKSTVLTVKDRPKKKNLKMSWLSIIPLFVFFAIIVAVSGYLLARVGITLAAQTGISETIVGGLLTAISTSLPELIIAIAAVKRKALAMAVGNIIGGNTFDVLFIAFADFAFIGGSILHAVTSSQIFLIATTILLTGILILGLLLREKYGPGKIGWESIIIILLFLLSYTVIFVYF